MEREALKLELEELAVRFSEGWHEGIKIDALDIVLLNEAAEALAQSEQEPVAWITKGGKGDLWWYRSVDENGNDNLDDVPLYMAPPQRPWVGLTDEEIKALSSWWPSYNQMPALMILARDIENSLKEKNT